MRRVVLQVATGELVAVVEIAPFPDAGMPRVVLWGSRVFVLYDNSESWVYREAFAVASLTPSPGLYADEPAPSVDRSRRCTVGEAVAPGEANTADRGDGQQKGYVILCDEERAKGFVRPVRCSYIHVGIRPKYPTVDLTAEEKAKHAPLDYVCFEAYPEGSHERSGSSVTGRYWTAAQLKSGCGTRTTMGQKIAETYARDPGFYSGTFCSRCATHLPVGAAGEFVWDGTDERVGT